MKSKLILALAISSGMLSACDSDTHTPEFDGVGDIYVRCQKIDDVVKYAPVIYAYSNMYLSSAKMSHSDAHSPEITLTKVGENATNFASLPKTIDYSETDVKNGTYNFEFTSTDNEVLNLTDKLLEVRIAAIEISKFEYNKDQHSIEIEWGTVENRDTYHVKIATAIDGRIVYSSNRLNNNALTIDQEAQGWDRNYTMKSGTTYTVSVSAYKFESSNTQNGYHINQESVEYREIEW
ncbi:hypothetical protein L3073_09310 [Ancylomarina sp. DW003]|nr:hypothetical protein [Ancylomarina sp. DW003]MDE5422402.1 hypothetical protein [Ancylomarina sp. DW003]